MTDVFHKEYKPLDEEQKALIANIKYIAEALYNTINNHAGQLPAGEAQRYFAVAKTKLEEVVMWSVKGVTSVEPKVPETVEDGAQVPDRNIV